jgi:hemoglobin-like flavoprotein
MTPREIFLIQNSFRQLRSITDHAGAIFFARLFEIEPASRSLFHGDIAEQGNRMIQTVGYFVIGLDQLDVTLKALRQSGLRQSDFRFNDSLFQSIGDTLLWTLSRCLGTNFTMEVRSAWAKAYWLLAETMKAGMRDGRAQLSRAVA